MAENFISDLLWRMPSDRIIFPIIEKYSSKRVLDAGCGTGGYSKRFLKENNRVIGIDIRPEICEADIEVKRLNAADFAPAMKGENFDIVFSSWMTEYLGPEDLSGFFKCAYAVLNKGGIIITTVISDKGWGWLYVKLARLIRGSDKYFYAKEFSLKKIEDAGFREIRIIDLDSYLGVPWAYLVMGVKP